MLIPNLSLTYKKRLATDLYGTESLGVQASERCAIVKLRYEAQHTTVRADSSGSRGYAAEFAASTKILVLKDTAIEIGDQITVQGIVLRVVSKFPRHSVIGLLDHFELTGVPWA
jgi:hypothetical protein